MPRRLVVPCVLLVAALLAGCHGTPVGDRPLEMSWTVGGTFTENTTNEDLGDLKARLLPYDAELRVMESFPMQFHIEGPGADDCVQVREMLHGLPYVRETGQCMEPDDPTGDPDGGADPS